MRGVCGECGLPVEEDDPHGRVDDDDQAWHSQCLSEKYEREDYVREQLGVDDE